MDKDLASIQEARDLTSQAYEAWKVWSKASQEQVDRVCAAMAEAAFSALWKDEEIGLSFAGSFSQALGMPGGFELTLSLATPEGGYALEVLPVPPPVLAIEFSFPLV